MTAPKVVEMVDHKARKDIGEHIAECNQHKQMIKQWAEENKTNYEKLDKKMDVHQGATNTRFDKINNKLWAAILGLVGLLITIIFFLLET